MDKAISMIDSLYKPSKGRVLYILISEEEKEPTKITMPIKFVSMILKNFGKIPNLNIKGLEQLDSEQVSKLILMAIEKEAIGQLVELKSSNNEVVKISII
ncbi:hypothetical protein SDC9_179949 [bioreactor metagenome]|uniref:Uncharacterized protein n=1 Tax=bioreactor metagenome TaxID=1076179 RepID=A0A645H093_9ZZZZ